MSYLEFENTKNVCSNCNHLQRHHQQDVRMVHLEEEFFEQKMVKKRTRKTPFASIAKYSLPLQIEKDGNQLL